MTPTAIEETTKEKKTQKKHWELTMYHSKKTQYQFVEKIVSV